MIRQAISNRAFSAVSSVWNSSRGFATELSLVNLTVNEKTGIATLELNRPPVNGLNTALLNDIASALDETAKNRAKGLILTSASDTVFSAGIDLLELYKPVPEKAKIFWTAMQEVWLKLYGSTYPTAAAINGQSPAGGCLLSLSCEYRVMLPKFYIGLNETQLGIMPPAWFQASMRNVLSRRDAERALMLGTMFSTEEAHKIGLVDEIANDKADALDRCEKYLLKYSKISPQARALTKQIFRGADLEQLQKNREQDVEWFLAGVSDEKVQKGLGLYLESLKKKK